MMMRIKVHARLILLIFLHLLLWKSSSATAFSEGLNLEMLCFCEFLIVTCYVLKLLSQRPSHS